MSLTDAQRRERKALEGKRYRGTLNAAEEKRLNQLKAAARPGRPRKETPRAPDPLPTPPPEDAPKASSGPDDLPGVDMGAPPPPPPPTVNPKRASLIEMIAGGVTGIVRSANVVVIDGGGLGLPKDGPIHDTFFSELHAAMTRIAEKRIPISAGSDELDEWFVGGSAAIICGQAAYFSFRTAKKPAPRPAPAVAAQPATNGATPETPPSPPPQDNRNMDYEERPVRVGSLGALVTSSPVA